MLEIARYPPLLKKLQKLKRLKLGRESNLFDSVADKHSLILEQEVHRSFLSTPSSQIRFVTLLDSIVELNIDLALERAQFIKRNLEAIQKRISELKIIGAFEFEIVSFDLMKAYRQGDYEDASCNANKISVLSTLASVRQTYREYCGMQLPEEVAGSRVLVHIHALVDFGTDTDSNIAAFKKAISYVEEWKLHSTQLDVKSLYSTRSYRENIKTLCRYMTKGGNEELHYKLFYGRDKDIFIEEEYLAAIYRFPFDTKGMKRREIINLRNAMYDDIAFENNRHLTHAEIRFLNDLNNAGMRLSNSRNRTGYLFTIGK